MLSTRAPAIAAISSTSCGACAMTERAERQGRVGGLVHDHVVRDLVDERLSLAHLAQRLAGRDAQRAAARLKTSTGPRPPRCLRDRARPLGGRGGGEDGRLLERVAAGQAHREDSRVRAAGAVGRPGVMPVYRDLDVLAAVEEVVDGLVAVTTRDDHGRSAERMNPLSQLAGTREPASASASGRFGVTTVASGNRLETRAPTASSWSSFAPELATITGSTTSGTGCSEVRGDGFDDRAREQHPGLRCVDADVVEDRFELSGDELRRHLVHRADADRVLRGQRNDGTHPVRATACKRLQVGLDPAAARVRARDRQTSRNETPRTMRLRGRTGRLPSPVRTGSGSTGVISAALGGTPVGQG